MAFMPFQILGIWLRGLFSVALLVGAGYLLYRWYDDSHVLARTEPVVATEVVPDRDDARNPPPAGRDARAVRVFRFDPGWNRETAYLAAGVALLVWATLGQL